MTAFSYKVLMAQSESVTGREARALQTEETGHKSQTFFYFSLKRQEETNVGREGKAGAFHIGNGKG